MPSLKQELFATFQSVLRQRDQARLGLARANETVSLLEAEIAAVKYHGDAAFAQLAEQQGIPRHRPQLDPDSDPGSYWIDGVWLAGQEENADLLGAAERSWKTNLMNPQESLNMAGLAAKGTANKADKIKCTLIVAAIKIASGQTGQTEVAGGLANEALAECETDFRFRQLAGMAHWIRGHVFLKLGCLNQAYWDFSLALFTRGYHDQAKYYQMYTENRILQRDGRGDGLVPYATPAHYPSPFAAGVPALKLPPEIPELVEGFKLEEKGKSPA